MENLPIINNKYNCFDDGKIKQSRLYEVTIKEIIPFDKIDSDTLEQWQDEVNECHWLYAKNTDYFIKTWNGSDNEIFVRTLQGKWFSMGYLNSGILDLDGSLTKLIQ